MINFNYKEMSDHRLQELLLSINENISSYKSSIKSINESKDYHKSLIDMKKSCINEMVHRLDESNKLYESVGYNKSKIDSVVGKFQGFYETLTDAQKLKCESYKKSLDKVLEGLNKFLSKYIAKSYYNFGDIVSIDLKNPTLVSFNESLDKLDKRFDKLVTEALQASYPDCPSVNDSSKEFIDDTQDDPSQPTIDSATNVEDKDMDKSEVKEALTNLDMTDHPEYLIDVDKDEVETLGECVVNESYLREASHLIPKEWKRKVLIVEDEASIECVLSTVVNTTSNTLNGGSEERSVGFRVITDSIPSSFGISFFDEDKQKEFYESVPKKFDSIKQFIDYLVDIYNSYPRTSAPYNIENIAKDLGYNDKTETIKVDTESSESEDKDEKVEESYDYFDDDLKSEFDDDELDAYCKGYSDAADEDDGLITISDEFENKE